MIGIIMLPNMKTVAASEVDDSSKQTEKNHFNFQENIVKHMKKVWIFEEKNVRKRKMVMTYNGEHFNYPPKPESFKFLSYQAYLLMI